MIADIILGITVDTEMWIYDLKKKNYDNIYVVDYDYFGEPILKNEVIYISPIDAKVQFEKFDSKYFYKSLYAYPGMDGKFSSLKK